MNSTYGDYVWYELMTTDAGKASDFYTALLNWQIEDDGHYAMIRASDPDSGEQHGIAGMLTLTEDMQAHGARPVWLGYVAVADLQQSLSSIQQAGGNVLMPARHIAETGEIAMVADPQGVPIYLIEPEGEGSSLAFAYDRPRPGHCAWNELVTTDPAGAMAFYTSLFGWTKDGEMNMGPMGKYEFLRHSSAFGAIMPKPEEVPVPAWNYYFRVKDIDRAAETVFAKGGQVIVPPMEVPGGDFCLQGIDPCGAQFSLVGQRVQEQLT